MVKNSPVPNIREPGEKLHAIRLELTLFCCVMAAVGFTSMNSLRGPYNMYKTVKFLLKALVVDIPQKVQ